MSGICVCKMHPDLRIGIFRMNVLIMIIQPDMVKVVMDAEVEVLVIPVTTIQTVTDREEAREIPLGNQMTIDEERSVTSRVPLTEEGIVDRRQTGDLRERAG